jgi:Ala-tRNA(Pro) deacylase
MNDQELLAFFNKHGLNFTLHEHMAVFSAKDDCEVMKLIPGGHSKNLFLKDKKKNYVLVSVLEHKNVDLKRLAENIDKGRFSFGNEAELSKFVGVLPGSVTPFGLINDAQKQVAYYLDQDFLVHESVNFHPLRNDQTVNMQLHSFLKFFDLINHTPQVIEIPELEQ